MDDQRTDRKGGGRLTFFLTGARRGLKFGAMAGIVIWLVICLVCLLIVAFIPEAREHAREDLQKQTVLSEIGSIVAGFSLMALYGAVPGAIIMGISAMRGAKRDDFTVEQE